MIEFSNLKDLAGPFAELQLELLNPKKATQAFNYKYAQLDQILEMIKTPLAEKGFSVIQAPFSSDGEIGVETMLLYKTGDFLRAKFSTKTTLTDPQKIGSIITYYRRYSILSIFNLAPEDDDAASASQSAQNKQNKSNNYNKNNNQQRQQQQKPGLATKEQKEKIMQLMGSAFAHLSPDKLKDFHKMNTARANEVIAGLTSK
jgi:hypothetical protein